LSWMGVEKRAAAQKAAREATEKAKRVPCPDDCSGNGKCNSKTGLCKCFPGYYGINCAPQNCAKACSRHGTCLVPKGQVVGYCMCHPGWMGETCDEKTCFDCGFAEGRGRCADHAKRRCECVNGWEGRHCERRACASGCSGHGVCVEGKCSCDGDWTGTDCSIERECPNNCNGHGQCRFGHCYCDEGPLGYHGRDCAYPNDNGVRTYRSKRDPKLAVPPKQLPWLLRPRKFTCDPPCEPHGKCMPLDENGAPIVGLPPAGANFVCFCESGYVGATCELRAPGAKFEPPRVVFRQEHA